MVVYYLLVLHPPQVLLPRTARLYAKLASGFLKWINAKNGCLLFIGFASATRFATSHCSALRKTCKWVLKVDKC